MLHFNGNNSTPSTTQTPACRSLLRSNLPIERRALAELLYLEESIDRLAKSIKDKGQLSPIKVRWSEKDSKWVIVFGEQRWRAVQSVGLPTIQCHFHEDPIPQSEILEQQLIENCLRDDLRPIEEAQAFACLMEVNSWNGQQLADALLRPLVNVVCGNSSLSP